MNYGGVAPPFSGYGKQTLEFRKIQVMGKQVSSLCVNSITLLKKFQEWDADPCTLLLDPCMLSFK